jgi:hypothetical protein
MDLCDRPVDRDLELEVEMRIAPGKELLLVDPELFRDVTEGVFGRGSFAVFEVADVGGGVVGGR